VAVRQSVAGACHWVIGWVSLQLASRPDTSFVARNGCCGSKLARSPSGYSGLPEIDSSTQTAVHWESESPASIGEAGEPNTISAPVRSASQHNHLTAEADIEMCLDDASTRNGSVRDGHDLVNTTSFKMTSRAKRELRAIIKWADSFPKLDNSGPTRGSMN
jgi:hypothetical protein